MKKFCLAVFVFIICTNVYPQEINVAKINGFEMYYEVHGTGNPMILLHGFCSHGKWWNFVIDDLSQHFQLIIPDLRGHGRSTNPLEQWTMEQSAKDIFALMLSVELG